MSGAAGNVGGDRYRSNAQGSVSELATELLIAHKLEYLNADICGKLSVMLDSIGRMIVGLSRHLAARTATG